MIMQTNESSREDMLSGVLLHVIAAAGRVDLSADRSSRREIFDWRFEVVDDSSILGVSDLGDFELLVFDRDRADVENLSSTGGIEGGAVEDQGWAGSGWGFC